MSPDPSKPSSTQWPFEACPLSPALGAEIVGINLEEACNKAVFPAIYEDFLTYQVLLFRDIDLPPDLQVQFTRSFGKVQVHVMDQYHGYKDHPEIYVLSNLDERGNPNGIHPDQGTLHWHTDCSWLARTGQATLMYAEMVPSEGGETHFCDMYGAYEHLDQDMKNYLQTIQAIHNLDFSRSRRHGDDPMTEAQKAKVPPVAHPVVRTHPETERKCIFLGDHAEYIQGLDYDESRPYVEGLNRMITPNHLIYRHKWSPREVIVWDNRCLLHRATTYDTTTQRRVMRRCTVLGDEPR